MSQNVIVVQSEPVEGREKEYLEWYAGQHLHDVVSVPGFRTARFYAASEYLRPGAPKPAFGYLAVYEVDCTVEEALENLRVALEAGMYITPAMKPGRLVHGYTLESELSSAEARS